MTTHGLIRFFRGARAHARIRASVETDTVFSIYTYICDLFQNMKMGIEVSSSLPLRTPSYTHYTLNPTQTRYHKIPVMLDRIDLNQTQRNRIV